MTTVAAHAVEDAIAQVARCHDQELPFKRFGKASREGRFEDLVTRTRLVDSLSERRYLYCRAGLLLDQEVLAIFLRHGLSDPRRWNLTCMPPHPLGYLELRRASWQC
jgi:hypothetical protein